MTGVLTSRGDTDTVEAATGAEMAGWGHQTLEEAGRTLPWSLLRERGPVAPGFGLQLAEGTFLSFRGSSL